MKAIIFLLFFFLYETACCQSDTLNRLDIKNRKTGYWTCYLDSNLNLASKDAAVYYAYQYYRNGKKEVPKFVSSKWRKKCKMTFEPFDPTDISQPRLLNGKVQYFSEDSLIALEVYDHGRPQYWEERFYDYKKGESMSSIHYFDSSYNNQPFTYLNYSIDNGVPLSKQYYGRGLKTDIIYFDPHRSVTSIHRPRIGYSYQRRSFLELGYSRKYSKVTFMEDGRTYFDNDFFAGYTFSLLGSWNKKKENYFGQKALFTYCLSFVNTEAGFVNYTDFHRNDLRFTAGAGLTFLGRISLMYHYSHPLLNNPFGDISRHSLSVILF